MQLVKRIPMVLALALMMACGKNGPSADGQRWCELEKQIKTARAENNLNQLHTLKQQKRQLYKELEERYGKDEEGTKELDIAFQSCMREYEKSGSKK